jgi:hypothetical protein
MDVLRENPQLVHAIRVANLVVKSASRPLLQDRLANHRVSSNRRGRWGQVL